MTIRKFFAKPYWTAQLTQSRNNRESFYEKYRHTKSARNIMLWNNIILLLFNIESHLGTWNKSTRFDWPIHLISEPLNLNYMKTSEKYIKEIWRKVNILRDGNTIFSTVPEISNQLARTCSNVSSPDNDRHNFLTMKNRIETVSLNFLSNNIENYNKIFTINELDTALNRTGNPSSVHELVFYQMLKRLPTKMKEYFLKVMKKYWIESYFPNKWREAVVIKVYIPRRQVNAW